MDPLNSNGWNGHVRKLLHIIPMSSDLNTLIYQIFYVTVKSRRSPLGSQTLTQVFTHFMQWVNHVMPLDADVKHILSRVNQTFTTFYAIK